MSFEFKNLSHHIPSVMRGFVASISLLLCLAATTPASASEQDFRDWKMTCPEDGRGCALSTTSFAEDRTWLSTVRMQPGKNNEKLPVQILVPPQVHLASGIFVIVPGVGEREAVYQRCTSRACDARLTLVEKDIAAWKQARFAELLYRPSPSAPPIRFQVSLMGLTAAMTAMSEISE